MNWIVTGYSGKNDGLMYVVEADDGKLACEKVAKLEGLIFTQIEYGADPEDCKGVADIFYHQEQNLQDHIDSYANGDGPRRCYEVYYEPVTLNRNLTGAVCW
jgi:hypothetical protein